MLLGELGEEIGASERDGHDYLQMAARAGASVAIVQDPSRTDLPTLVVNDTRRAAVVAASAAQGWPARDLKSAELRASMVKVGFEPTGGSPQDFAALIAEQLQRWEPIVKASGFQMD